MCCVVILCVDVVCVCYKVFVMCVCVVVVFDVMCVVLLCFEVLESVFFVCSCVWCCIV